MRCSAQLFTAHVPYPIGMRSLDAVIEVTNKSIVDSSLDATCTAFECAGADGYDAWHVWAIELLRQYADCAARHAKKVHAWPK